ncbi:unnamed protein product [Pleuronectes platessa]|uniref:Uncharacterized protein n=1 Tax=Pleuronectes platessa TaxID=8262 RepID=A0A9N7TM63_PLEPL|nr:unnamed protein product [Pleuronectes platessa]
MLTEGVASALPQKKSPSHEHGLSPVLSAASVKPPFTRPALALFGRDRWLSVRGSPAASRAQRVAAWLRKRSELQRGGSLRCAVTRMYRRCYGGFRDPSLYVVRAPFAASDRDLIPSERSVLEGSPNGHNSAPWTATYGFLPLIGLF